MCVCIYIYIYVYIYIHTHTHMYVYVINKELSKHPVFSINTIKRIQSKSLIMTSKYNTILQQVFLEGIKKLKTRVPVDEEVISQRLDKQKLHLQK